MKEFISELIAKAVADGVITKSEQEGLLADKSVPDNELVEAFAELLFNKLKGLDGNHETKLQELTNIVNYYAEITDQFHFISKVKIFNHTSFETATKLKEEMITLINLTESNPVKQRIQIANQFNAIISKLPDILNKARSPGKKSVKNLDHPVQQVPRVIPPHHVMNNEVIAQPIEVAVVPKANSVILAENRSAVLAFADKIPPRNDAVLNTTQLLNDAKAKVELGDLTAAIRMFDQLKDMRLGIVWHESEDLGNGTKALVRDARNVTQYTSDLKVDAGEKYAMQILNEIRAATTLLDQNKELGDDAKATAKAQLKFLAASSIADIGSLPKNIKKYNTQLVHILEKAGIKDVQKALIFAKEIANFQDEHRHIVTLTTAIDKDAKKHTVSEADIMLNGLTATQKAQWLAIADGTWPNIANIGWYSKMPKYKQDLLKAVALDIADGKKVIPTQLLGEIPGIKNAYQKVTAVKAEDSASSTIIAQVLHCGAPATKIKEISAEEKNFIIEEQVRQLQSFVPEGEAVNLHALTSKTPLDNRHEDFISNQLSDTNLANVKFSASPINRWRLLPQSGEDHREFSEALIAIGNDKKIKEKAPNISKLLINGSSIKEKLAKWIGIPYQSTESKAMAELEQLDPELKKALTQAIKARDLIDSNLLFVDGNRNLRISAAMSIVENSVKLKHGALHQILSEETRKKVSTCIDFCKSGKDRTGYLQTKKTHEAVSSHLGVDPNSELGQANMVSQVAGGHTQEMAGTQGGSIGSHSVKTNPEFGLSSDKQDQAVAGILNQKSSSYNSSIKTVEESLYNRTQKLVTKIYYIAFSGAKKEEPPTPKRDKITKTFDTVFNESPINKQLQEQLAAKKAQAPSLSPSENHGVTHPHQHQVVI